MKNFLAASLLAGFAFAAAAANPVVEMETSAGSMSIELYPEKAPGTVENFLNYARSGFYAGTVFHRVIDGFMIQGGGFDANMKEKPTREPIRNEAKNGLHNQIGTIAMARTRDPHSAAAQFFINLVDNPSLDYPSFDGWGYAVFGKVTKGLEVVRQIGKVKTTTVGYYQDVPAQPVVIKSVRIIEDVKADK
ncbi:MAG: peptidylprolyl isomerase [Rhodocyclaceae bacterium]